MMSGDVGRMLRECWRICEGFIGKMMGVNTVYCVRRGVLFRVGAEVFFGVVAFWCLKRVPALNARIPWV